LMIMDFQALNPLSTQTLIRKATDQDLIHLEWDGEYRHFRKLYQEIYESSKKGDAILWVVELNGTGIIGQVFIQLDSVRKDLADGRARAYLYGFRIQPEYRNLGIGSYLLRYVEEDLVSRGFLKVCLNVGRENIDACRLYDRNGYQIVGVEAGNWSYVDENGLRKQVNEPAWRMEKLLDGKQVNNG
jgi:ribosomal protein S18 acetylase RimI-like enzyme